MITRRSLVGLVAAVIFLSTSLAPAAHAGNPRFDLTGTWTGVIKCKSFDGGAKDSFTLTPSMRISQSGLDIGLQLFYGPGDVENYVGLANPDAKKPFLKGELAVVACDTNDKVGDDPNDDPNYDEVGRISVSTKPPNVKASFKGTSIYSDPGIFPAEAGTCKWKWTRTDDHDPGVQTSCGATTLRLPPTTP